MKKAEIDFQRLGSDRRLRKLHGHLTSNNRCHLTLKEAAALACLEQHYFSAYFHDRVGVTFSDWQQYLRIEQAKDMLTNCDPTIGQISSKLGYRDPSSFVRFFRRHTSLAPSAYRAQRQQSSLHSKES